MATTLTRPAAAPADNPPSARRWECWLLRLLLAAAAVYALIRGEPGGAAAAVVALGLSFAPWWVGARSGVPVPRLLEQLWLLALALPALSDALGLYDHVIHWGKLVHGLEGGLVAAIAALLLLGFRDQRQLELPNQMAAIASIFIGATAGALWEIVEFLVDWVRASDLQKSNADTMTDMLWADLAATVVGLFAVRLYCHALEPRQQQALGAVAEWLFAPLGRLLDRHGKLMVLAAVLLIAAFIASLWFTGRPVPGLLLD